MGRIDLPYIDTIKAKGRTYYYYRRGKNRQRIKGSPEDATFHTEYARIHNAASDADARAERKARVLQGSLAALVCAYRASPEWE